MSTNLPKQPLPLLKRLENLSWIIGLDPSNAQFRDHDDCTAVGTDLDRILFEQEVDIYLAEAKEQTKPIICRGTLREFLESLNQFHEEHKEEHEDWFNEGSFKSFKEYKVYRKGVKCYRIFFS